MSKKVIIIESCNDCPNVNMNTNGKFVCEETYQTVNDNMTNKTINEYCPLVDYPKTSCCKDK